MLDGLGTPPDGVSNPNRGHGDALNLNIVVGAQAQWVLGHIYVVGLVTQTWLKVCKYFRFVSFFKTLHDFIFISK